MKCTPIMSALLSVDSDPDMDEALRRVRQGQGGSGGVR